jgi:phosphopantetheine adenylyltransferase
MGKKTPTDTSPIRRRSQRLFLQIRVVIEGNASGKPAFEENTRTIIVNAHGALVELAAAVEEGQKLLLKNSQTNEKQESIVKLVSAGEGRNFNVAVEFTTPNPDFWSVNFPPEDWTGKHPDAKRPV